MGHFEAHLVRRAGARASGSLRGLLMGHTFFAGAGPKLASAGALMGESSEVGKSMFSRLR